MSAFLSTPASEINLCAEYGYSVRDFAKQPRVMVCSEYKSCMFLAHHQSRALPNRHANYRNHFTLFRGPDSILVVRAETTLTYSDQDVVLTYDSIRIDSGNVENCMRASRDSWDVSFDRNISYSNARPENFADRELIGSGEWWFFDRGVVLNGVTKYVPDVECLSLFVYYELHPKFVLRKIDKSLPTTATAADRAGGGGSDEPANEEAIRPTTFEQQRQPSTERFLHTLEKNKESVAAVPNVNSRIMMSLVNSSSRSIIRANERVRAPDVQYRSVMPSLFWLKSRSVELHRCDISYFLPTNYKCAYGAN